MNKKTLWSKLASNQYWLKSMTLLYFNMLLLYQNQNQNGSRKCTENTHHGDIKIILEYVCPKYTVNDCFGKYWV